MNNADPINSIFAAIRAYDRPCYAGFHEDKFTENLLRRYGGENVITVSEYSENARQTLNKIPAVPGVYFVTTMHPAEPDDFLAVGSGGYFKGKNPNVSKSELHTNWVDGASILYIGKAGGRKTDGSQYKATLRQRIKQLLQFGSGKNTGHFGGRYLWQCEDSNAFKIHWYPMSIDEDPIELENQLIAQFILQYGKLPFANLQQPSYQAR